MITRCSFLFSRPRKRTRYLPWYLGNVLNCALRMRSLYDTGNLACFLLCHQAIPELPVDTFKMAFTYSILFGEEKYAETDECEAFVGDTHEEIMKGRPIILWGLAIDPSTNDRDRHSPAQTGAGQSRRRKNAILPGNSR